VFEGACVARAFSACEERRKIFIRMAGTWDGIQTTHRDNVINITAVTLSSM